MADMTFAVTITGTIAGKLFNWTRTATVADVDDMMTAYCESAGGENGFFTAKSGGQTSSTMHTYDGMAAVMIVGLNTNGLNGVSLLGATPTLVFMCSPKFPFIAYNGGGFNGMFNQSSTATDVPDEDPEGFSVGPTGGRNKYSAIGALKAIS